MQSWQIRLLSLLFISFIINHNRYFEFRLLNRTPSNGSHNETIYIYTIYIYTYIYYMNFSISRSSPRRTHESYATKNGANNKACPHFISISPLMRQTFVGRRTQNWNQKARLDGKAPTPIRQSIRKQRRRTLYIQILQFIRFAFSASMNLVQMS